MSEQPLDDRALRSRGDVVPPHVAVDGLRMAPQASSDSTHGQTFVPIETANLLGPERSDLAAAAAAVLIERCSNWNLVASHVITNGSWRNADPAGDGSLGQALVPVETMDHSFPDVRDGAKVFRWCAPMKVSEHSVKLSALDSRPLAEFGNDTAKIIDLADVEHITRTTCRCARFLERDTAGAEELPYFFERLQVGITEVEESLPDATIFQVDTSTSLAVEEARHVRPIHNPKYIDNQGRRQAEVSRG